MSTTDDVDTIGSRITQARRLLDGLTSSELAELAGLHRTHLSNLETGARNGVEGKTAVALSGVLGVSTDWLLTGKGDAPTVEQVRAAVDYAREAKKDTEAAAALKAG